MLRKAIEAAARPLVSTAELAGVLGHCTILDASWYMPVDKRDTQAEWRAGPRIPGARFFDIDGVSDPNGLPHMLPTKPEDWAAHMARLGVSQSRPVVVYDSSPQGLFSAARCWWSLRAYGHQDVTVLDGGLTRWIAEGRPVERGEPAADVAVAVPAETWSLDVAAIRSAAQVRSTLEARAAAGGKGAPVRPLELVIDARAAARFQGSAPEPRAGLRSGHMPGARNVPFNTLLAPAAAGGGLLPPEQLRAVFAAAGVDVQRPGPIVTSCGSGITACVLALGLERAGRSVGTRSSGAGTVAVYDGSWTEWAGLPQNAEGAPGAPMVINGPADASPAEEL